MNPQNLQKLATYFHSQGITAALLSNPATITWLTGYAPPIQTGLSPFEGGPALLWWRDRDVTFMLSDAEASNVKVDALDVRAYLGYSFEQPLQGFDHQAAVLRDLLREHHTLHGRVGIEMNFMPQTLGDLVREMLPDATLQPLDGHLNGLRTVKTGDEVVKLRAVLALCDLAQAHVQGNVHAGVSEIELWADVKGQLEVHAGMRLPAFPDVVGGIRSAGVGGLPSSYVLQAGDPLIFDFLPRLDGYWGDCAGTYFAEEPSEILRKAYASVQDTLRQGIDGVRPRVRACDLDAQMRASIQKAGYPAYPHHSGHGLGTTYHEEPRIVPYNRLPLEAGMVIALEPGIYLPGVGGVRLEDVVLVTVHGCERLTHHLDCL